MKSSRLEAFVDAVVAIILTVLMLELPRPKGFVLKSITDLHLYYFTYLVSFLIMAVFWVNHHKIYQRIEKIDDRNLWVNIAMLFVLSFSPYLTEWMEEYPNKFLPAFAYWMFFFLVNILFYLLFRTLVRTNPNSMTDQDKRSSRRMLITMALVLLISLLLGIFIRPMLIEIGCLITTIIWIYGVSKI